MSTQQEHHSKLLPCKFCILFFLAGLHRARGSAEDSPSSRVCIYTHHDRSSGETTPSQPLCQTPTSEPPSRPLSSASTHSHGSVFATLRSRSKTLSSSGKGSAGTRHSPTLPASDTMAALQKELRSFLTLSVARREERSRTPPAFGRSSSSSSTGSSGISAGSWSSSPMHEVPPTVQHGVNSRRSTYSASTSSQCKSAASTPSPFTSGPPIIVGVRIL